MKLRKAAIRGIKVYLPPTQLTNDQLVEEFGDPTITKIFENIGIESRRIAGPAECASDLGVRAAQELLNNSNWTSSDIDFLLFCTQTPDYFLPASACIMQKRLGLPMRCGAVDVNSGCAGFVHGLGLAKGLIETGQATNVLLITGETLSKTINPKDRSTRPIFGDGATATLISALETEVEAIGPFSFGTDGQGAKDLIIPAGGWRIRPTPETAREKIDPSGNIRSDQELFMDGAEIFNFALDKVPKVVNQLLKKSQMDLTDVDFFIFHQANKFLLEALRRKIKIPKEKFIVNLKRFANTSSSTIPIALEMALQEGKINKRDRCLLVGFGVGFSWAATMIIII
ncbi:MAG: ketoacyl-ACP synthase III [Deltaproteobacteria bacterium]|nr:ketoacyl-ACP synthase III [Deltaproteobacteria bacterium]MBW1952467.1 ketoacyl-ACP synthase III [Deltaproteobacteria bacterium]MBW1987396.1 ketoacyl-ACP synthase III [Deltaproteobacteria bacterium]MBW2135179.1 ketoacyl-ACP synthase III [Deltaproteobacteria bacterium]